MLELLVVVLIIGILAGIALPQYQLAVDKSEFAKLYSAAKDLADSYTRYHIITNQTASSFSVLDIDFPYDVEKKVVAHGYVCRINGNMYCCVLGLNNNSTIICGKTDYSFASWLTNVRTNPKPSCMAKNDSSRATKLCKSLWNKQTVTYSSNLFTPEGIVSGLWTIYPM